MGELKVYSIFLISLNQTQGLSIYMLEVLVQIMLQYIIIWSEHVNRMVGKANRILGMFNRTFENRNLKVWKELNVSQLRPH